jgi:hypothetical protein
MHQKDVHKSNEDSDEHRDQKDPFAGHDVGEDASK